FQMEKRLLRRGGSIVWINITIAPLILEEKESPLHFCMIEDITERKKSDEALRRHDIQLKKITSMAPGMLYQFRMRPDGTFHVPFSNEAIKDIYGFSPQDVLEDFSPI